MKVRLEIVVDHTLDDEEMLALKSSLGEGVTAQDVEAMAEQNASNAKEVLAEEIGCDVDEIIKYEVTVKEDD